MKLRWYISTLIIILTLLGVVNQQQISIPNQEIILQFTDTEVTPDETQNTIAIVKKQLQDLGVNHIQVTEEEQGKLKITYYSEIDVASIKETLSNQETLALNSSNQDQNEKDSDFPIDKNLNGYNLDVYEIQKDSGSGWNLNGTYISELKPEGHRFYNPNIYAFIEDIEVRKIIEKIAYKTYCNIAIAIDNTSHKTPEVRAGPIT